MELENGANAKLITEFGEFDIAIFINKSNEEIVVLSKGEFKKDEPILVRIHSECLTGEVFHSLFCDCDYQLEFALKKIQKENKGILIYLRQEGRGVGLKNKIRAYSLQNQGVDTVDANLKLGLPVDSRIYDDAVGILKIFGIKNIRLLTNNPKKINVLESAGFLVERIAVESPINSFNKKYLETKKNRLGHLLDNV